MYSLPLLVSLLALAAGFAPATQADLQPFVGTWKEDTSKTKVVPTSNDVLTYERAEDGSFVETRGEGANARRTTLKIDGKEHPVEDQPGMTRTWTQVRPDTWESVWKRDGQVIGTTRRVVSEGGRALTVSVTLKGERGEDKFTDVYQRATGQGDGLIGKWKLISSKSDTPDVFVRSVTSSGELKSFRPASGMTYTAKFDGKDYPLTGPTVLPNYTVSLRRVGARSIEETIKREGRVESVITTTVSPDGKTLTGTFADPIAKGEPSSFVYEKQ
jgi:hypothetical protein